MMLISATIAPAAYLVDTIPARMFLPPLPGSEHESISEASPEKFPFRIFPSYRARGESHDGKDGLPSIHPSQECHGS
jgi:hypothetical protein